MLSAACSSGTGDGGAATSSAPSSTASTTSGTTAPGASPTSDSADRTIAITVQGKNVTPAPSRVEMTSSQTLRLVVTSDHDDELHAHGFDVEKQLVAGQPTTVDLTGAPPGLYEVETHDPELRLLQVVVR